MDSMVREIREEPKRGEKWLRVNQINYLSSLFLYTLIFLFPYSGLLSSRHTFLPPVEILGLKPPCFSRLSSQFIDY